MFLVNIGDGGEVNAVSCLQFHTPVFLSSLALGDDTFHFVEPAICTRRTMFNNIAAHLPRSTALAGFRSPTLHRPETIAIVAIVAIVCTSQRTASLLASYLGGCRSFVAHRREDLGGYGSWWGRHILVKVR